MDANELRALADALDDCDPPYYESSPQINRSLDACIAKAADYLRAQADAQPVAVPAGWKWVPVEPTPEMLSAVGMMDGYDWHAPGCSPDADHANWYSAMIAAAPAVPQAEPCIGNNPTCPCQDGDACHYRDAADGTKGWPVPQAEPIDPHMIVADDRFPDAQAEPKRKPLSDERIDTALQTDPVLITRLMIGSMTVSEFRAALRRLARIVERALEIGGSDAE